jgi:hypothetical protein
VYEALVGALDRGLLDRPVAVKDASFRSLFIHNTRFGNERVDCKMYIPPTATVRIILRPHRSVGVMRRMTPKFSGTIALHTMLRPLLLAETSVS